MTRTFKIAVVTSRDGKHWSAQGWGTDKSGDADIGDLMMSCVDCVDAFDLVQFEATITVDIPEPIAVQGVAVEVK